MRTVANSNTVTAESGADTPVDGVDDVVVDEQSPHIYEQNRAMRQRFLELSAQMAAAREAGDDRGAALLKERRQRVGNDFIAANQKLAYAGARDFTRAATPQDREVIEQAAFAGLWMAFAGTTAAAVDSFGRDSDGNVVSAHGWDPEKGTFGTWSRSFISGEVRRAVAACEAKYAHMKYSGFSKKPAVDAARRELAAELGRTPTYEQIAQRAKVTVETVRICSSSAPVSLSTPLGEDGGATLGDKVAANAVTEDTADEADVAETAVLLAAEQMRALDLFCVLMRQGITGRPELSVVETADRLGVGRGMVNIGYKRGKKAIEAAVTALAESSGYDVADPAETGTRPAAEPATEPEPTVTAAGEDEVQAQLTLELV